MTNRGRPVPASQNWQTGALAWAKMTGFPWWPAVVFLSWEDVDTWGIRVKAFTPGSELERDQVVVYFIQSMDFQVITADDSALRNYKTYKDQYANLNCPKSAKSKQKIHMNRLRRAVEEAESLPKIVDGDDTILDRDAALQTSSFNTEEDVAAAIAAKKGVSQPKGGASRAKTGGSSRASVTSGSSRAPPVQRGPKQRKAAAEQKSTSQEAKQAKPVARAAVAQPAGEPADVAGQPAPSGGIKAEPEEATEEQQEPPAQSPGAASVKSAKQSPAAKAEPAEPGWYAPVRRIRHMPTNQGKPVKNALDQAWEMCPDGPVKQQLALARHPAVFQGNSSGLAKAVVLHQLYLATGEPYEVGAKASLLFEELQRDFEEYGHDLDKLGDVRKEREAQRRQEKRNQQVESEQQVGALVEAEPITLQTLVRDGVIKPAKDILTIPHKEQTVVASLLENGRIEFESGEWDDVSAFVAHVRGVRASGRNAYSAWSSVFYGEHCLDCFSTGKFVAPSRPEAEAPEEESPAKAALKEDGRASVVAPSSKAPIKQPVPKQKNVIRLNVPSLELVALQREKRTRDAMVAKVVEEHLQRKERERASIERAQELSRERAQREREAKLEQQQQQPAKRKRPRTKAQVSSPKSEDLWSKPTPLSRHLFPGSKKVPAGEVTIDPRVDLVSDRGVWQDEIFTDESSSDEDDEDKNRTEYSVNRLRDSSQRAHSASLRVAQLAKALLTGVADAHTMVQCEPYSNGNASAQPSRRGGLQVGEQPFQIKVMPEVCFVCDLHAHLADAEVIGFLGGRWDAEALTLYIQAAFPCRAAESCGWDGMTDVEMDPSSEMHVREVIATQKLEVIGWYHSHPVFQPDPSITDIQNQANYQSLMMDTNSGIAPFVGLIVGTYDTSMPTANSIHRWFHTKQEMVGGVPVDVPMLLTPQIRQRRPEILSKEQCQVYRASKEATKAARRAHRQQGLLQAQEAAAAEAALREEAAEAKRQRKSEQRKLRELQKKQLKEQELAQEPEASSAIEGSIPQSVAVTSQPIEAAAGATLEQMQPDHAGDSAVHPVTEQQNPAGSEAVDEPAEIDAEPIQIPEVELGAGRAHTPGNLQAPTLADAPAAVQEGPPAVFQERQVVEEAPNQVADAANVPGLTVDTAGAEATLLGSDEAASPGDAPVLLIEESRRPSQPVVVADEPAIAPTGEKLPQVDGAGDIPASTAPEPTAASAGDPGKPKIEPGEPAQAKELYRDAAPEMGNHDSWQGAHGLVRPDSELSNALPAGMMAMPMLHSQRADPRMHYQHPAASNGSGAGYGLNPIDLPIVQSEEAVLYHSQFVSGMAEGVPLPNRLSSEGFGYCAPQHMRHQPPPLQSTVPYSLPTHPGPAVLVNFTSSQLRYDTQQVYETQQRTKNVETSGQFPPFGGYSSGHGQPAAANTAFTQLGRDPTWERAQKRRRHEQGTDFGAMATTGGVNEHQVASNYIDQRMIPKPSGQGLDCMIPGAHLQLAQMAAGEHGGGEMQQIPAGSKSSGCNVMFNRVSTVPLEPTNSHVQKESSLASQMINAPALQRVGGSAPSISVPHAQDGSTAQPILTTAPVICNTNTLPGHQGMNATLIPPESVHAVRGTEAAPMPMTPQPFRIQMTEISQPIPPTNVPVQTVEESRPVMQPSGKVSDTVTSQQAQQQEISIEPSPAEGQMTQSMPAPCKVEAALPADASTAAGLSQPKPRIKIKSAVDLSAPSPEKVEKAKKADDPTHSGTNGHMRPSGGPTLSQLCEMESALLSQDKYGPNSSPLVVQINGLALYYKTFSKRVDPTEVWRQGMTKGEKTKQSLSRWLPLLGVDEQHREVLLDDVLQCIQQSWESSAETHPRTTKRRKVH